MRARCRLIGRTCNADGGDDAGTSMDILPRVEQRQIAGIPNLGGKQQDLDIDTAGMRIGVLWATGGEANALMSPSRPPVKMKRSHGEVVMHLREFLWAAGSEATVFHILKKTRSWGYYEGSDERERWAMKKGRVT